MHLDVWLLILAFAGMIFGGWSIALARTHPRQSRIVWGRRIFVVTLLGLGASGLVAAFARADGLVSLGLLAGLLMVAMLWESPSQGPLVVED
jgi:hypothetical protein